MIDTETYGPADLTQRDYNRIESSIVDLYAELNIREFPIDPFYIAKQKGYEVIPYSKIAEEARYILRKTERSGTSGRTKKGVFRIFYDDSDCEYRQRFTIMHEIGHIELGHKEDSTYAEKCANYYATYSLAPSPMIVRLGCEDFIDISIRFNVSDESAMYAFDRFTRWANIPCGLKPYEEKLNKLFD